MANVNINSRREELNMISIIPSTFLYLEEQNKQEYMRAVLSQSL